MPAAQAGLLPGDIILAIDGKGIAPCEEPGSEAQARYSAAVSEKLRGEPGTTFELKVRRPEADKEFTFKIARRNIVLPSVSLSTMITDSIGYIALAQFIEGTSGEVRRAMVELKQQGMRNLILDLRGNPGGVLEEAVRTVNLFLPRGREVLSTRGKVKELNHTYKTTLDRTGAAYPILLADETELKSAVRANPGLMLLHDGRIAAKWSNNNLPEYRDEDDIATNVPTSSTSPLTRMLLWFIVPLIIIIFLDGLWVGSKYYKRYRIRKRIFSKQQNPKQ